MERRLKLHFLARLIPFAERNYNLVELGPRGTGKSYAVQELSPYGALLTGPTTVANLFGHMNGKHKGMVSIWDVVAFDEVADLQKMPKEVITTLKTYCESGTFQRGKEAMTGEAGIALFGNTNQPIEIMVQTGHLFEPMPDVIRDDMAFIDRIHFYLPGWEIPKMRNEFFTDHYGFVVDYLAEALRAMRKLNFSEVIDNRVRPGCSPECSRPQGGPQDGLGADEADLPARSGQQGRTRGDPRAGTRGSAAGQGAAQEDGLLRVLPHVVQLSRHRDGRRAVRGRARAGWTRHDLAGPACSRLDLYRFGRRGWHGWLVPDRGQHLGRHRQAESGRRHQRSDKGVDQSSLQLPAHLGRPISASAARSTRRTFTSR